MADEHGGAIGTAAREKAEGLLEELLQVMKEQRRVLGLLLDLETKKRASLVKVDLKELEKIVVSEELLVAEAGEIEERRYRVSCSLAEEMGLIPEEVSISGLRDLFPCQAEGIEAVRQELQEILGELQELNQQNYDLIQQSLQYVDFAINLITRGEASLTYSHPQGKEATAQKAILSRLLDRRV